MDIRGASLIDLFGMAPDQVSRMEGVAPTGPRLRLYQALALLGVSYLYGGNVPNLHEHHLSRLGAHSAAGVEIGRTGAEDLKARRAPLEGERPFR